MPLLALPEALRHGRLVAGPGAAEGVRAPLGADALTVYRPPGGGMAKVFCSVCGSSLFGSDWPGGEEVSVRLRVSTRSPEPQSIIDRLAAFSDA